MSWKTITSELSDPQMKGTNGEKEKKKKIFTSLTTEIFVSFEHKKESKSLDVYQGWDVQENDVNLKKNWIILEMQAAFLMGHMTQ